jgi:hypothetical protein
MRAPSGASPSSTAPFLSALGGTFILMKSTVISPSRQSANSSWPQANHGETPSARMTSWTYSMFLATTTRS